MFKDFSNQSGIFNLKIADNKTRLSNRVLLITTLCFLFVSASGFAQFATPSPLPLPGQLTSDPQNDLLKVGYCLNQAGSNSCTANDFTITSLTTLNVDDGCSSPTDYMQIDLSVTFAKQVPARYDVGAWFYRGPDAAGGIDFNTQDAVTGDFCTREGVASGLLLPLPAGGTSGALDGDTCTDVPSGDIGDLSPQTIFNLVLPCRDLAYTNSSGVPVPIDGITDISACTSWKNLGKNDCLDDQYREFDLAWPNSPFADEIQPSTGSKCNCGEFDGGPLIVSVPDMAVAKSCTPTTLRPGETTTCTITLTNNGLGILVGAELNPDAGFFYEDDYPESQGSIDAGSIVITPSASSAGNTVEDQFILNADGTDSVNQSLNIYPGDIGPGETFSVVYDFVTVGDATLPDTDPVNIITNTVCTTYYNQSESEVHTYPDTGGNCATAVVTTPVSISSFKASESQLSSGYDFTWTTSTETGNLGFNIYAIIGQTRFKLNDQLIPSAVVDGMGVQEYSYQVNSKFNGMAHKFIIEDVDRLGRKSSNGIYKLGEQFGVAGDVLMQKHTDWGSINSEFEAVTQLKNKQISSTFNEKSRLSTKQSNITKVLMEIDKSGIYKVSYDDLINLGIDLTNVQASSISVKSEDGLVPIDLYNANNTQSLSSGSYFQFYAKAVESLYTDKNVYTLSFDNSAPSPEMAVIPAAPQGNQYTISYDKTVKINRNQLYGFSSPIASEPWFDSRLLAVKSPLTSYFNIKARDLIVDEAKISFEYWGGLDFDDDNLDHNIGFKINGLDLGSDKFDGLTSRNKSFTLSSDVLQQSNEIELFLPADTVNKVDLINLESISLTYTSRLVADHNKISFQHEANNYKVIGFENPDVTVYAIQEDTIVKLKNYNVKREVNYTFDLQFSGIEGLADYVIATNNAVTTPGMKLSQSKDVSLEATKHLIISHANFMGRELTNYAKATRSDYRIVDVQDIYSLYSGNKPDGEAIKSFISDLAQNGELESVMLVGGDTYDYKDYSGIGSISFVPTIYRETDEIIKFSAVDALFGDIDNDSIPDIPVGRLPVRTLKELNTIIAKTNLYRDQIGELSAVLAADDSESLSSYHFTASSNQLVAQLEEEDWSISTAYLDEKSITETREEIMASMNEGVRLAIYTGHSSSRRWGFEGLFKNTDVDSLINVDNPFGVVQWGCWNTYFVDPTEDSLGHEFMLSGKKGAAFVLGASTLTDADQESYFATIFNEKLLSEGQTIGSAMLNAKIEFSDNRNLLHKDILWGVTILGDPLIQVK